MSELCCGQPLFFPPGSGAWRKRVVIRVLAGVLAAFFVFGAGLSGARAAASEKAAAQALPAGTGVMLAAFGTGEPGALASYKAIAEAYDALGVPVAWAYTSDILRDKMAKSGTKLAAPDEALDELAAKGVKTVRVQSLHLAAGEEYAQLERVVYAHVLRHPGRFAAVYMGRPLLESERDMKDVAAAILSEFPRERKPTDAIVLMGHGHADGRADLPVFAARDEFRRRDPLVFLATVEGSLGFDRILPALKAKSVRHVWLAPFMMVAGDHARNDLAGSDPESWASRLKAAGMTVSVHLKGLGELAGIRDVFVRHTLETRDNLMNVKGVR